MMLWVRMFKIRNGVDKVRHYRTEAGERVYISRKFGVRWLTAAQIDRE